MSTPLFADAEPSEVIERDPVRLFLNRWCFNWRGERAVIERELRELIAVERLAIPAGTDEE